MVGYDGTDSARLAVEEAAALAQGMDADLHIVQVVIDERPRGGMAAAWVDSPMQEAAAARQQGRDELAIEGTQHVAQAFPDVRVHPEVLHGPPATVLVERAEHLGADLIVVGNRRVQGISRVLGSVAIDVLRHAHCSVYVAHTN